VAAVAAGVDEESLAGDARVAEVAAERLDERLLVGARVRRVANLLIRSSQRDNVNITFNMSDQSRKSA
jgi:hypothetical protein